MKHRGCKLVVSAVLALAVLCFSPPAFGADSASLASLGPSVGNSQSTGGAFDKVAALPEAMVVRFPGAGNKVVYKQALSAFAFFRNQGIGSVVVYNGQPCQLYEVRADGKYYHALVNFNGVAVKVW